MKSRAAFYGQPLLSYGSFSRTSSAAFLDKKTDKYKIFKIFCQKKNSFQHLQKKKKKKYSSKHNGYIFVVNIAQNFVNDYNKNFYLCTRHI